MCRLKKNMNFFPASSTYCKMKTLVLAYKRCTLVLVVVYQNLELELVLSTEIFHNTIRFQGFLYSVYKLKI